MAIHIQKKTSETDEAVEKVNKELIMCQSNIQERDIEIQGLKEDIEKSKSKESGLISKLNDFESKEADFQMELNQIQIKSDSDAWFFSEHQFWLFEEILERADQFLT